MTSKAATYWDQAMTPDAYLKQMTMNRDVLEPRIASTTISASILKDFSAQRLRFLILTEDFCGDSAQFIPPIIRLGQVIESVEVRLLLRDQHRELAAGYVREDGYQAIPVVIALAENGEELGYLIERPARATRAMAAESIRFARENPELEGVNRTYDKMAPATKTAVRANIEQFRDQQQAEWTTWLFEDLAPVVAGSAGPHLDEAAG